MQNLKIMNCDVAVVGAGPAGATAARESVRRGLDTIIIEKHSIPRYKICSGLLIPESIALDMMKWLLVTCKMRKGGLPNG